MNIADIGQNTAYFFTLSVTRLIRYPSNPISFNPKIHCL